MSRILDLSTHVRLVPASKRAILDRSRGPITKSPIAYDLYRREGPQGEAVPFAERRLVPERGGLYDEALFGPLDAPDPTALAHIELGFALAHPVHGTEVDVVAVLPAAYRRHDEPRGAEITFAYGRLYATARRAARYLELDAPERVIAPELERAARDLATLIDNRFHATPALVGAEQRRLGSLVDLLDTRDPIELEAVLLAIGWTLERS